MVRRHAGAWVNDVTECFLAGSKGPPPHCGNRQGLVLERNYCKRAGVAVMGWRNDRHFPWLAGWLFAERNRAACSAMNERAAHACLSQQFRGAFDGVTFSNGAQVK